MCVAQVGAPHGVRGEVRLKSFTEIPEALAGYGPLTSEDGARTFEIVALRTCKGGLIARFTDIDSRDAAEALRNVPLFALREKFAPPDVDEFYHTDLIGLTAVGTDGRALGAVAAVQNFGAGDLLEIAWHHSPLTVFVPFTKAFVPVVDIAAKRVVVDPPDGTFEPGGAAAR